MHLKIPIHRLARISLLASLAGLALSGCSTPEQTLTLGVIGATLAGAHAPTHEIQQTYYLGVFDPQDQLPPAVYRIRVHGQASFISQMNFASGWVRADLIDSLGTTISIAKDTGRVSIEKANDDDELAKIVTGRKLVLFGPEGFREAPKDHRLVIVMGSSPENYFSAMDQALGQVSGAIEAQRESALNRLLFEALAGLGTERELLHRLETDMAQSPTN